MHVCFGTLKVAGGIQYQVYNIDPICSIEANHSFLDFEEQHITGIP